MKTTLLILFAVLLFVPVELIAQNTKQRKTYKVWITLVDGSVEKGVLYSANEQGVKILNDTSKDAPKVVSIEADKINVIKLRRKGKVGRGAGIGALAGITSGVIYGSSTKEKDGFLSDLGNSMNMAAGVIVLGTVGTGVGAIASSKKNEILINNHLGVYKEQLAALKSHSLKAN